jgi:hypothetical protein
MPRTLTALVLLALATVAPAEDAWEIKVCPGASAWEGVTVDGQLSEPVWSRAPLVSGFVAYNSGELIVPQTAFRVAYDSRYLYLGVECEEPLVGKIAAVKLSRDALAVFSGECLEIFIDPKHDSNYYQLGIDPAGSVYDSHLQDASWNADVQAATHIGDGKWTAELAIDWKSLGVAPTPGTLLGLNVCRDRYIGPERQWSCWSRVAANFHDPIHFGHVVLSPTARQIATLAPRLREGGRTGPVLVYGRDGLWGGSYRKMAADALDRVDALLAEMDATAASEADAAAQRELTTRVAAYRTRVAALRAPVVSSRKLDATEWTQLDLQVSTLTRELGAAVWDARLSALLGRL